MSLNMGAFPEGSALSNKCAAFDLVLFILRTALQLSLEK